jgi:hypothetical protein
MPFSELSPDNREWLKSVEDLDWRFSAEGDGYVARKTFKGDKEPTEISADSFIVAINQVEAEEKRRGGEIATGEVADPENPDGRLPGMEEPEIGELNNLADVAIASKIAKDLAVSKFKDDCDIMREKMREYERKRYTRGGFTLVIEDSEKLQIKKAEAAPPKNPSTKKNGVKVVKGGGK